jgi:hypothetical protein
MRTSALVAGAALALFAGMAQATTYVTDVTLADFASTSSDFATLSNTADKDAGFAATFASLAAGLRTWNGGTETGLPSTNDWILATFSDPEASIRVFPNVDHPSQSFDGFQYSIEGSNDLKTWTALFDVTKVLGGGPFTIGSFTGTAPTRVDNTVLGVAGPGGKVGYIADFTFGTAYKYYAFGASTVAVKARNPLQELSAVSAIVPEPTSWALLILGFGGIGCALRARRSGVQTLA